MKARYHFLVVLLFITLCFSADAQNTDSLAKRKKDLDSILSSEHLDMLTGTAPVHYSANFQIRAKTLQGLFVNCINYYERILPGTKFNVNIYILGKIDWDRPHTGFPYGMPFYHPDYRVLFVPAEKNALRRLTGLPDDPVKSDSVLSTFDFQPIHELGHYYFFTLNGIYKEKWMNEFLATYFLICFIQAKGLAPDLQKELQANFPVAHRTLDEFEKLYLGVGPSNYHWYQSKFAMLGYSLYPQFKEKLITLVLQNYAPGGKNLDAKSFLLSVSPDTVTAWLNEMK